MAADAGVCTEQDIERFESTHYFTGESSSIIQRGQTSQVRRQSLLSSPFTPEAVQVDHRAPDGQPGYHLHLVGGRNHPTLSSDISRLLGVPLSDVESTRDPNGELVIKVKDNLKGGDVFVVQPMGRNKELGIDVNEALLECLNLIHALRLAAPRRITAVIPHFAYARQDRKTRPRVPIAASATAQLLMAMGVDRVLTVDLHSAQIQGFFHNTPVDNLPVYKEWANYVKKVVCVREHMECREVTVVAPDANGVERATKTADQMGEGNKVVTILRRRIAQSTDDATAKEALIQTDIVGEVAGDVCVIVDDIVDSGATLCSGAEILAEKGARAVYACITHGLFSSDCAERVSKCSAITQVACLDTLPGIRELRAACPKVVAVSCAPLLAEAIGRQHQEQPLSAVFR